MLQLLAIGLLAYVIYRFWKGLNHNPLGGDASSSTYSDNTPRSIDSVKCAHCGVHMPVDEAVRSPRGDNKLYCTPEHAEKGPRFRRH